MKNLITLLFFVSISNASSAKTIVISDMDDTIKTSHILHEPSMVTNAFNTNNLFLGMPDLYQIIKQNMPDTEFYYVSNGPVSLMKKSHTKFLKRHNFPKGSLLLRTHLGEKFHKEKTIRQILEKTKPDFVIMIGDNGERDTVVYRQMTEEHNNINSITFIRQAYSTQPSHTGELGQPLEKGQIGFVSPFEIALKLNQLQKITDPSIDKLESGFVKKALENANNEDSGNHGAIAFPNWVDCRDFTIPRELLERKTKLSELFVDRVQSRCSIPALIDYVPPFRD